MAKAARRGSPARLQGFEIPGPAGILECLLQEPPDREPGVAVLLCHPHPLHGGTLHNKVVHRAASVFVERGAAALRLNFRGVGASEGHFDGGLGELDDARAGWAWLTYRYPRAHRWVAGFSFGSWVAARLGASEPACERMVLIAPPVASQDFAVLESSAVPKLVVQGAADDICPLAVLEQRIPAWSEPRRLVIVPGATHFFDKQLAAFAQALREGLEGAP